MKHARDRDLSIATRFNLSMPVSTVKDGQVNRGPLCRKAFFNLTTWAS